VPLYEYECKPNHHRFEARHGYNDEAIKVCPECGGEVRRVIQPVGIVFKGSGFYATDSRSASTAAKPAENKDKDKDKAAAPTASTDKGGSEPSSKPVETKSDSKPEASASSSS